MTVFPHLDWNCAQVTCLSVRKSHDRTERGEVGEGRMLV